MRVGLLYNLRKDFPRHPGSPLDAAADWDDRSTIDEVASGLGAGGATVVDVGDPRSLFEPRTRERIDLVFSICEMTGLRHREALVPALCEFWRLPYAFSPPDVMVVTLDKNLANLVVAQAGIAVPDWWVVDDRHSLSELTIYPHPEIPFIVKPVAEGSGMGIASAAVVTSPGALRWRVTHVVSSYGQPALIQRFCQGRELTVGVIERDGVPEAMAAMELNDARGRSLLAYGSNEKEHPEKLVRWTPLAPGDALGENARDLAVRCHVALGCRDASRVDLRQDAHGDLCFLECNPLPHLHPLTGDFCRSASAMGWRYEALLGAIVASAASRTVLPERAPATTTGRP